VTRLHPERSDGQALWGLVALFLLTGCGTTCEQLAHDHAQILAGAGEPAPGPHLELVLPFDLVNEQLAVAVKELEPGRLVLPEFAALNAFSGGFTVRARALRIVAGRDGAVGFRLEAGVRYKRKTLTTLKLAFDAPVVAERDGRSLSIGLGDLRAAPDFADGAAKEMAKTLHPLLPGPLRVVVPRKKIREISKITLMKLEEDTHGLLKEPLLDPLLAAARIRIKLPDWPMGSLTLRTRPGPLGGLVLGITTTLGGAATLGASLRERGGPAGIRIHLPGATAAALANHLAAKGVLPARVDGTGRPDPKGDLAVTYGWRPGLRPLKVDLWKLDAPCAALRVGGTPVVEVDGETVLLTVPDGRLEQVRGDPLVKLGAALTGLWAKVFDVEVDAMRRMVVRIAGRRLRLSLDEVLGHDDGWTVGLALAPAG
jgi:hypothetical protein